MSKATSVAMLVQTVDLYDIRRIVASFVAVQPNGELHNIAWDFFGDTADARAFAKFEVTAYVGDRDSFGPYTSGRIWGCGFGYHDLDIVSRSERARDMGNLLARVERGLSRLNTDEGYAAEGDFGLYALRVAKILRVSQFYVRSLRAAQERSGERYRKVTGAGVQDYARTVEQLADKADFRELNER